MAAGQLLGAASALSRQGISEVGGPHEHGEVWPSGEQVKYLVRATYLHAYSDAVLSHLVTVTLA